MPVTNPLAQTWERTSRMPFGRYVFSKVLSTLVPYSGTIRPLVLELRPGYARIQMRDRKAVRNHLQSIHAIALMNLAELTGGLALNVGMPDDARGIVTGLSIDYLKKARGTLIGECDYPMPDMSTEREIEVVTELKDTSGDVVARATARWKIGPRPTK